MIFFILWFSFVVSSQEIQNKSKCFNVTDWVSLSDNEISLTIKGNGTMCDCYNDELSRYSSSVKVLQFEDSVKSIGKKCFEHFESLTSVQLGKGITQIHDGAFYNTKLQELEITKNVILIESNAFSENKELTKITFEKIKEGKDILINKFIL